MRVTEQRELAGMMGKRKHKLHKKGKKETLNSDSSDEATNSVSGLKCQHIQKAVNFGTLKKALKQNGVGDCKDCEVANEKSSSKPGSPILGVAGGDEASDPSLVTVWLCMQCGNQGCDRNSRYKHALQHYKTPRSSSHAIVLNLSMWCLWCYDCDEEIILDGNNKKLSEAVEYIRKWAGSGSSGSSAGKSLLRMDSKEEEGEGGEIMRKEDHTRSLLQRSDSTNKPKPPVSNAHLPKVKGLSNLGNTCFFNAVMQNMSVTAVLESVLSEGSKETPVALPGRTRPLSSDSSEDDDDEDGEQKPKWMDLAPLTIQLGNRCDGLTQSMLSFLKDMHNLGKNTVISPSPLFSQVCRKAPRFKGFQQQDSHELLRHLLEGIKTEEIQRAQKAILKKFELVEGVKNANKLDDDLKMKVKEYGRLAKHTVVDDVFGGYFISTVLCEECQVPSQILEPFLDISLPITEEKTVRPTNVFSCHRVLGKKEKHAGPPPSMSSSAPLALEEDDLDGGDKGGETGATSKHMNKKQKKQARKIAKRKGSSVSMQEKTAGDREENNTAPSPPPQVNGIDNTNTADNADNTNTADNADNSEENDMSDADIEDNIESDVSRKLQRSVSATESIDSRRKQAGSPEGSASNTEFSVTSEDTTLVEDSGSTINGDRANSPQNISKNSEESIVKQLADAVQDLKVESDEVSVESSNLHNNIPVQNGVSSEKVVLLRQQKQAARHELCRRGATSTLAARYQTVSHECSVRSCLHQFTSAELLTGNNKFGCENCTRLKNDGSMKNKDGKRELVYCNASKQHLIFSPPLILTLHLKRFCQDGFRLKKVGRKVDFDNVLDLAPYCSELCEGVDSGQTKVLYCLYGIVEHSGSLAGGHYTAYVKVRSQSDQAHVARFLHQGCRIQGRKLHHILQELDRKRQKFSAQQSRTPSPDHESQDASKDSAGPLPPPPPGRWFYISDSKVSEVVNENNIFNREAYLLFYERWH